MSTFHPHIPGRRGSVGPLQAPIPPESVVDAAPIQRVSSVGFNTLAEGRVVDVPAGESVQLCGPNPVRRYLFVQNIETEDVYIGGGARVTNANGLHIKKNCGHEFTQDNMYKGELWVYAVNATTVRVFEGI